MISIFDMGPILAENGCQNLSDFILNLQRYDEKQPIPYWSLFE